jgi:DnaA family protein
VAQLLLPLRLTPQATFDSFFAADDKALEVMHLLQNLPESQVVWIWGGSGSGKTHLLQAVCAHSNAGGRRVSYSDLATVDASTALSGLEGFDVVVLDNLQEIMGDPAGEQALFRLYNELLALGGCLVMAAGASPVELAAQLPDLASRLAAAMVYRLPALDEEAQLEVLHLRARENGLELTAQAARYLVNRVDRNMASLCTWLDTLDKASLASHRSRLTVPFVSAVLADGVVLDAPD